MDFDQPSNVLSMTGTEGGGIVRTTGKQTIRGVKTFKDDVIFDKNIYTNNIISKTPANDLNMNSYADTTMVALGATSINAVGIVSLESSGSNVNATAANSINLLATNGVTISSSNTTGDINLSSGDNISIAANAINGVVALSATGSSGDITLTSNAVNGLISTSADQTTTNGGDLNLNNDFINRLGGLMPNISIYAVQGQNANPLGSWTTCTMNYSIGSILNAGDTQFVSFPYRVLCCWVSVCFDSRSFNGFTNRNIDFRFQDTGGTTLAQSSLSGGLSNADRACVCMFAGNSINANTPITPQFRWTGTGSLTDTKRFVCYLMFQQA